MVSTSICLPSTDTGMGNPIIGSVCNKVESQTSTICVPCSRSISHGSRCSVNELDALWAYTYPPPALLPRVLEKAQQDQYELILIAPHWPQAIWFPLLLGTFFGYYSKLEVRSIEIRPISSYTRGGYPGYPLQQRPFGQCCLPCQRESTLVIYESKWRIFTAWCNIQHINPFSATESVVSDFLLHLHTEKHMAISTIAGYQIANASTLRATSGAEVGRNPALKSLLRNIEMEQAPSTSFSRVESRLSFVALTKPPFEPLDQASDQLLTWKTVFLIALASGKRRCEIHAFKHARLQRTTGWTWVTL